MEDSLDGAEERFTGTEDRRDVVEDSRDVVEDNLGGAGDNRGSAEDNRGVAKESRDDTISSPVAGLGVDIIEVKRMEKAMNRTPRILVRVFSETERLYAWQKTRPAVHFALFFAAKEAVLKALGTGFTGMAFTDVEVDHDRFGRPIPLLHGRAKAIAQEQGVVEMQLSLSYTHTVGVASAVAIKEQDRPHKENKADPRTELARQFKEVRAILDGMDERLRDLEDEVFEEEDELEEETENGGFEEEEPGMGWFCEENFGIENFGKENSEEENFGEGRFVRKGLGGERLIREGNKFDDIQDYSDD